jgi:ankyrin repeat protein
MQDMTKIFSIIKTKNIELLKDIISNDKACVNSIDEYGDIPLHMALEDIELVKLLMEAGADVNGQDEFGFTALHKAVEYGNLEIIKFLIKSGADINSKDKERYSPLHIAIISGNIEIIRFLIKKGADVNCKNYCKVTPLHLVPMYLEEEAIEAAELLVEKGGDIEAKDNNGNTFMSIILLEKRLDLMEFAIKKLSGVNNFKIELIHKNT